MTQLQEYALIEDNQIIRTEWFKRPSLVPEGDWRVIGEVVPSFNSSTHQLGEKMLGIREGGAVAYMWSVVPLPPPQVPVEIQMWQAHTILFRSGLLDQVDGGLARGGGGVLDDRQLLGTKGQGHG